MSLAQKMNMSLDHTLHPGRPGPEELVPSRYALQVGAIDVLVVSDGVLPLPGAMLGHNADPAVRAAWLDDMFLPPDLLDWALNVVVVRSGGQTILIDAGLGADPDLNLPRAGQLVQRLEAAGIDLASVTDVVLTHLHMDHIGGLLVDGVRDRLRPDLRVHVAAAEAEFWAVARFLPRLHAAGVPGRASADRQAVLERVPQPVTAVRDGARGGAGRGRHAHRRPHPRAQRGPRGVRRRPADIRRRRRVPGRVRAPRLVQRLRARPRGGGPRPGPAAAGAGGEPASSWWPLTCRSRPSAVSQSPATSFVGFRAPGSSDPLGIGPNKIENFRSDRDGVGVPDQLTPIRVERTLAIPASPPFASR